MRMQGLMNLVPNHPASPSEGTFSENKKRGESGGGRNRTYAMLVSSVDVGPIEWPESWSFVLLLNKINSLALYRLSYTPRSVASRPPHHRGCWWLILDLKEPVSGMGTCPFSLTSLIYAGHVPPPFRTNNRPSMVQVADHFYRSIYAMIFFYRVVLMEGKLLMSRKLRGWNRICGRKTVR